MRTVFILPATLAAALLLSACQSESTETEASAEPKAEQTTTETKDAQPELGGKVTGTLTYRERIALSPDAVVEVFLEDVSRAGAVAKVLARQRISPPGNIPIAFELAYDPAQIDERMSYSVRARIMEGRQSIFVSDTSNPVITRGAGTHVDIVLKRTHRQPPKGTQVKPQGQSIQGMFRYMADAAQFRDCRTGKTFPVSMEGAYPALEAAYMRSDVEPGQEVMIKARGRFLERPGMEEGTRAIMMIPDNFMSLSTTESCSPQHSEELANTYWKLIDLDGIAVETPEGMKEAHMILKTVDGENRVQGNAGCNNFFGGFERKDFDLSFSTMGATMMACPVGMTTEQDFMKALGETTRFRISGQILTLFAGDKQLARLEAVHL